MKIVDYLDTKTINLEELDNFFKLEKTIEYDWQGDITKNCPNCNNKGSNRHLWRSCCWTSVYQAICCRKIIAIIHQDRLSGATLDVIKIYGDK